MIVIHYLCCFRISKSIPESLPSPVQSVPVCPIIRTDHLYSERLLESLGSLWNQQLLTDAVVASEDGLFQTQVHKVVLAGASPYFKAILDSAVQHVTNLVVSSKYWR
jgi:hypothetical protein